MVADERVQTFPYFRCLGTQGLESCHDLVHLSGTQVFGDVVNPEVSLFGALSIVQTGQLPGVLEGMPKVKNFDGVLYFPRVAPF
jgi:hypothetical protein